jgi:hypothetical protein
MLIFPHLKNQRKRMHCQSLMVDLSRERDRMRPIDGEGYKREVVLRKSRIETASCIELDKMRQIVYQKHLRVLVEVEESPCVRFESFDPLESRGTAHYISRLVYKPPWVLDNQVA